MTILGISAFYHDSAAALVRNGVVIAAAQEERFTRKKHDASFPVHAARFCLNYAGVSLNDIDAVAFYDKPLLKFERLLETYYTFAPKGLLSFMRSMPVWLKEKLFLKKLIRDALGEIEKTDTRKIKLLFPEHHLSHAASAFYPSPFTDAAILTIDGVGEWATASISKGEGNAITLLKELHFPHSLGLLYSAVTYYCGFKVNSGEYKLMGLAPYGNAGSAAVQQYSKLIRETLCEIKPDGSIYLDQSYFKYATGLTMVEERKWEKLFGFPRRDPEANLDQCYCDLALAVQTVTEEVVLAMAGEARKLTGSNNLCMAGGVALNCVANGKLQDAGLFSDLYIQPAAGDAGGALGAALAAAHIYFDIPRVPDPAALDGMKGSYLGGEATAEEIRSMAERYQAAFDYIADEKQLLEKTAGWLSAGNVVGWHQGRMEFGPRALGARSILADARDPEMQKKLNLKIKFREGFRPFAPIVKAEAVSTYFEHSGPSPYMLLVKPVRKDRQIPYPQAFEGKDLLDKLYFKRSELPAITHIDYSARLQTIHQQTNPRLWKLLDAFEAKTGVPVLVNTSFNVRGEPIVNTADDAYRCFMRTEMDFLVIGNFVFSKQGQPAWKENTNWKETFTPD